MLKRSYLTFFIDFIHLFPKNHPTEILTFNIFLTERKKRKILN